MSRACRAHRADETAQRGLSKIGRDADEDIARNDFHQRHRRACRNIFFLRVQEGLAPTEQLRRGNP